MPNNQKTKPAKMFQVTKMYTHYGNSWSSAHFGLNHCGGWGGKGRSDPTSKVTKITIYIYLFQYIYSYLKLLNYLYICIFIYIIFFCFCGYELWEVLSIFWIPELDTYVWNLFHMMCVFTVRLLKSPATLDLQPMQIPIKLSSFHEHYYKMWHNK